MSNTKYKKPRILNDYRVIHRPEHPSAMKSANWNGYIYEHIVIAGQFLGRAISDSEIVHHLDGNRQNNSQENLLVIEKNQHGKLHAWIAKGAPGAEKLRENWVNSVNPKFLPKVRETLDYCKVCYMILQQRQVGYCCEEHAQISNRKVERPSLDQLLIDIKTMPYTKVGIKYGVSDNAIRKWLKAYGINKATLSQARGIPLEGAETSGEVQPF